MHRSVLYAVYSPWDQSGWRCERGRCRCSRSRQRGELHRPSRASQARPTHGAPTRVASVGVAAVAVPGRSSPPENQHYCTHDRTVWAAVSQQQAAACGLCSWYLCVWSVTICGEAALMQTHVNYLLWTWEIISTVTQGQRFIVHLTADLFINWPVISWQNE